MKNYIVNNNGSIVGWLSDHDNTILGKDGSIKFSLYGNKLVSQKDGKIYTVQNDGRIIDSCKLQIGFFHGFTNMVHTSVPSSNPKQPGSGHQDSADHPTIYSKAAIGSEDKAASKAKKIGLAGKVAIASVIVAILGCLIVPLLSGVEGTQPIDNSSKHSSITSTTKQNSPALVSKNDKLNLKEQVCTEKLLDYVLDKKTTVSSTVKEFTVLSSRTNNDSDTSEVKVVLSDPLLERTLNISVHSTKYNQGWLVDYYDIEDSSFTLVGKPDQDFIASELSETYCDLSANNCYGIEGVRGNFKNFKELNSSIQDNVFHGVYEVNDHHKYLDVFGTLDITVTILTCFDTDDRFYVDRCLEYSIDSIKSEWHDIAGTYKLNIPNYFDLEQYVTIDKDENAYGYVEYTEEERDYYVKQGNEIDYNLISEETIHKDFELTFEKINYCAAVIAAPGIKSCNEMIVFGPDEIKFTCNGKLDGSGANYITDYSEKQQRVYFEKIS